jgi:AcrR family transcriptional regulator
MAGKGMNRRVTSKEQILDRAMEIAVEEGVDAVNIRRLSATCGISIGSVYNYFKDKEAIIREVSERFWSGILADQDKVYRPGMEFTTFLEQYYRYLYGKLVRYDKSWLMGMSGRSPEKDAIALLQKAIEEDRRVNRSIWNMDLNQDAFCEYVMTNIMALLRAGETNCRFFIFLLEHLLYHV